MSERPDIESIEKALKVYDHNRRLTGIEAHHHAATSQRFMVNSVPSLIAYIRQLEDERARVPDDALPSDFPPPGTWYDANTGNLVGIEEE